MEGELRLYGGSELQWQGQQGKVPVKLTILAHNRYYVPSFVSKVGNYDSQTACHQSKVAKIMQIAANPGTTGEAEKLSDTERHLRLLEATGSNGRQTKARWW